MARDYIGGSDSVSWYFSKVSRDGCGRFGLTADHFLAVVWQLPPGQKRQDSLKEIGRLRSRMYQLVERSAHVSTAATD